MVDELVVEFYGIPRQRSGTARTTIEWGADNARLGDLLTLLGDRYPRLSEACIDGRRLRRGCVANIDGRRFVTDPETPLVAGQSLLIMSADVGG